MNKTEVDPNSINNLLVEIICESSSWNTLDFDVENFIQEVVNNTIESINLSKLNKEIEISILLADDKKLHELNNTYLAKDKPTNVLSFPNYTLKVDNFLTELAKEDKIYLGDIALSYDTIIREAIEEEKSLKHHLAHMLIHSILHLIGYDHQTDDEFALMKALEVKLLKQMQIPNPY